jgi:hypothetical protein
MSGNMPSPFWLGVFSMSIKYQMHKAGMFPQIFCDSCGRGITISEGHVFWNDAGEISFGCFGACCRNLDKPSWPYSMDMGTFVVNLLQNIKATPAALKEAESSVMARMFGTAVSREDAAKDLR